jgi:hypothetical protein
LQESSLDFKIVRLFSGSELYNGLFSTQAVGCYEHTNSPSFSSSSSMSIHILPSKPTHNADILEHYTMLSTAPAADAPLFGLE